LGVRITVGSDAAYSAKLLWPLLLLLLIIIIIIIIIITMTMFMVLSS